MGKKDNRRTKKARITAKIVASKTTKKSATKK